jgi:hypothetical protein
LSPQRGRRGHGSGAVRWVRGCGDNSGQQRGGASLPGATEEEVVDRAKTLRSQEVVVYLGGGGFRRLLRRGEGILGGLGQAIGLLLIIAFAMLMIGT